MGASDMKNRGFDMYGTSREIFGLQVDCIVTSSIVVDFFHSCHVSIRDMSSNLDAFLVIFVYLNFFCSYKPGKRVKYNIHRNCSSMMLVHWRPFDPCGLDGAG